MLRQKNLVCGQQRPNKLFENVKRFCGADFEHEKNVTLALIADGGVKHRVKRGFVLGKSVEINDGAVNIAKFGIAAAASATRRRIERRILGA